MREIGSEFWKPIRQHMQENETIYLSGRTALDVIVKDAVRSHGISSALLPSYCCHTMIEPFLINGVHVRFYDVYVNDENALIADIPAPRENEMLYIMKYFGDIDLRYEGAGRLFSGWETTVEDLTHSCFDAEYSTKADYWFTSYRKWFAVAGIAVAGKRNDRLPEPVKGQNKVYSELRRRAFSMKQQFMDGMGVDKDIFLKLFSQAEQLLGENYQEFGAGYEEIYELFRFMDSMEELHRKRRSNALKLIDRLSGINGINIFVDFQTGKKCPLFVPVIVDQKVRDTLRNYLIGKKVYCPIHWPLSRQHEGLSERAIKLYKQELSLICDQRYDVDDIEHIIALLKDFFA